MPFSLDISPETEQYIRSIFYVGSGVWLFLSLRASRINKRNIAFVGMALHILFVGTRSGLAALKVEIPFVWQDIHDITIFLTYVLGFVQLRLGGFKQIPRIGRNENG